MNAARVAGLSLLGSALLILIGWFANAPSTNTPKTMPAPQTEPQKPQDKKPKLPFIRPREV